MRIPIDVLAVSRVVQPSQRLPGLTRRAMRTQQLDPTKAPARQRLTSSGRNSGGLAFVRFLELVDLFPLSEKHPVIGPASMAAILTS